MRTPQLLTRPERVRKNARQRIERGVRQGQSQLEAIGVVAISASSGDPDDAAAVLAGVADFDDEAFAVIGRPGRDSWEWRAPRGVAA